MARRISASEGACASLGEKEQQARAFLYYARDVTAGCWGLLA
jgi:hypothetical protein